MIKIGFASFVAGALLLGAGAASAQPQYTAQADSPQWLKDRRYNEGIGIRTGDLELHPGIAGEFGYDSNYFLRSTQDGVANGPGASQTPPIPVLSFRVTPSLYLSTISRQRREGDLTAAPPALMFRTGINATVREIVGISSDPASSLPQNKTSNQFNAGGAADARLDILPERPVGGAISANYSRVIQPNTGTANPNESFNRDNAGGGAEIALQPGGGTLDWHFGYQFFTTIFENSTADGFTNYTNEASTRGRWKFRPRTALVYDATLRFVTYVHSAEATQQGLVDSSPIRARLGLNGLITDRLALLAMAGWGAGFYDNLPAKQPDTVIAQAEVKFFLAANPGLSNPGDVGLALSSLALGYTRDFANSYLGDYYVTDRGYLKFFYFFAGRALLTLEGGVGAIEYPDIYNLSTTAGQANTKRADSFTDVRADATLFGEYRFTDAFGLNSTLRYTQNFSSTLVPEAGGSVGSCSTDKIGCYDMAWKRFEAYLGVRWFM